MKINLNGKQKEFTDAAKLNEIIEQFCKDTKHVIVEVNGSIIKRQNWNEHALQDGDSIELVNFVGGG